MIEFDVAKDMENLRKHGVSLMFAELLFEGPFVEEEDRRRDYAKRASSRPGRSLPLAAAPSS